MTPLPLQDLLVLDFSQFLAGPAAALRLADLGADVIKIERPGAGDLARQLYMCDLQIGGDSILFHSINRHKRSFAIDLKDASQRPKVLQLIERADVMIQNFRPGVIERLGLDFAAVRKINPRLVYGSVTGYGTAGPWRDLPGQDLLAQSRSGLVWLSGNADDPPIPFGLSVTDMYTGAHLAQGILACLVRRGITGEGGHVEVSLMESAVDLQFEVLTTHLNDGGRLPQRSQVSGANAYLAAPYGIYRTLDGYLAIAMTSVPALGRLLGLDALTQYTKATDGFEFRDQIKQHLAQHLRTRATQRWLDILEPADVWCAEVLDWKSLLRNEGFKALDMLQRVDLPDGHSMLTTRCPIRIDGQVIKHPRAAPRVGQHNDELDDMGLKREACA